MDVTLGEAFGSLVKGSFEAGPQSPARGHVGEGTTRRGTATRVHRPQRPAGVDTSLDEVYLALQCLESP